MTSYVLGLLLCAKSCSVLSATKDAGTAADAGKKMNHFGLKTLIIRTTTVAVLTFNILRREPDETRWTGSNFWRTDTSGRKVSVLGKNPLHKEN